MDFPHHCRCSAYGSHIRVGSDGKLYCTQCGKPVEGQPVKVETKILEFHPPPKKTDSK